MSSGKEILQAIKDKNVNLLEKLLSHTKVYFYDPASNEDTPLHEAVKVGSEEIVKMLIEKNHKVNGLNKFNDTPLHLAAMLPNMNIIKILVASGADLNIKNNRNKSPKDLAIEADNPEAVKLLLNFGCRPK